MAITPQVLINAKTPRPDGIKADATFALNATAIPLALASTVGVTSVEWSITAKPTGATTTIANATPTTPFATTFGPLDVTGTYILKCVVNGDAASAKEVAVAVLTPNLGFRKPARGETSQWDGAAWWGDDLSAMIDQADSTAFTTEVSSTAGFRSKSTTNKTYAFERIVEATHEDVGAPATFTLWSYTPPVGSTVEVTATVLATFEDSSESYRCEVRASFNVSGVGTVTMMTTSPVTPTDPESVGASAAVLTATLDTSGGAIRLRVTGANATLWYWGAEIGVSVRENG